LSAGAANLFKPRQYWPDLKHRLMPSRTTVEMAPPTEMLEALKTLKR
jgi:hypothetical protein